jgi:hypothetical protein
MTQEERRRRQREWYAANREDILRRRRDRYDPEKSAANFARWYLRPGVREHLSEYQLAYRRSGRGEAIHIDGQAIRMASLPPEMLTVARLIKDTRRMLGIGNHTNHPRKGTAR